MRHALLNILVMLLLVSCDNENESKQFSILDLYSMDLESGKWGNECYYLSVFDEKCLSEDDLGIVKFRFWIKERNIGTKIVSIFSYEEKGLIVVRKSIEAGYDGLFTIITERLPIKYDILKSSVSKSKFAEWRSAFIALLNSDSAIVENHDRDILRVEYREGKAIKKVELRGELSDELINLLNI